MESISTNFVENISTDCSQELDSQCSTWQVSFPLFVPVPGEDDKPSSHIKAGY